MRARNTVVRVGVGLFLAATFVMVSGDLPRVGLPDPRRITPSRILASPWLHLALFAASFVILLVGERRWLSARSTWMGALRPAIALLAGGFLVSVLFSQRPALSWLAYGCFLAVVGVGVCAARVFQHRTVVGAASVTIGLAALFLALRVLVWRAGEGLNVSPFHVGNNAWLGKLQIAWVLNFVAPLLLARFLETGPVVASAFYGITWLASGTALHVLYSRTGSVAFAVTTLAMCALNRQYWRRWAILLGVAVGAGLSVLGHSSGMSTHVVTSLLRADRDSGIVMRHGVWRETLPMIADHPLTGIGLGAYDDVAYSQYRSAADPHFFRNGWHAHNVFLHVLAETGIVGFAAWCYFWFAIVQFLLRRWRDTDGRDRLHSIAALCLVLSFFVLALTEVLIAARVHASLRMSLTLALLLVYGCGLASQTLDRPAHAA